MNPTNLVNAVASGQPAAALSSLYDTLEVRSVLTPTIRISTASILSDSNGQAPNPLVSFLKPTVVLSGAQGVITVAPAGEAGDGTLGLVAAVLGLIGLGFILGRVSTK